MKIFYRADLAKKQLIQRILAFIPVAVAEVGEEGAESFHFLLRHLQTDQNTADIAALITIMEQTDIPVRIHVVKKPHQCAWTLRKLKTVQQLILGQRAFAADQMADVYLGQFIVRQVKCVESLFFERLGNFGWLIGVVDLDADENVGSLGIADAIVEFSDVARPDGFTETFKAAMLFWNGDGKYSFARFAYIGHFCHEAQTVEVHVGAAGDGDQGFVLDRFFAVLGTFDIGLGTCHGQCTGRLNDATGILEDVLDGRTHGIGIDQNDVIDQLFGDAEGFFTHQFDGSAVGKQADVGQGDAAASFDAARHGVGIGGLYADDFDVRTHCLDIGGDARDQAAAADGDEDGVNRIRMLAQNFHANGALAGDDIRVVKRMDEGQFQFLFQRQCMVIRVGKRFAGQHHLATTRFDSIDLDLGSGGRHHNDSAASQSRSG